MLLKHLPERRWIQVRPVDDKIIASDPAKVITRRTTAPQQIIRRKMPRYIRRQLSIVPADKTASNDASPACRYGRYSSSSSHGLRGRLKKARSGIVAEAR
jgi:hypothetical protein